MKQKNNNLTFGVGLFGTCGCSTWRAPFIAEYEKLGIPFFNPQVDNWTPALAEVEAEHLANDPVILFPVTDETYGTGSLAESGFSIMQALKMEANRYVVIYIAPDVTDALKADNPALAKESLRARKLTLAHLAKMKGYNSKLFVVDDLDKMLAISLKLWQAVRLVQEAKILED
jgi:hypothetical protein